MYYAMQQSTEKQLRQIQWQRLITWDNSTSKVAYMHVKTMIDK